MMTGSSRAIAVGLGIILLVLWERSNALWYVAQGIRVGLLAVIVWESRGLFRRSPHVIGVLLAAGLFTACGGTAPTAPTPEPSFLDGAWQGSMTISRTGLPDTVAATSWTFTTIPLTGQTGYTTTISIKDSWLAVDMTFSASLAPPSPGGQLVTSGNYRSPRQCEGSVAFDGTAQPSRIDVTFRGLDCEQPTQTSVFTGHGVLTKR